MDFDFCGSGYSIERIWLLRLKFVVKDDFLSFFYFFKIVVVVVEDIVVVEDEDCCCSLTCRSICYFFLFLRFVVVENDYVDFLIFLI